MKQYFALPPAARDRHCTALSNSLQLCTGFESPSSCLSDNPFSIQAANVADNQEGSKSFTGTPGSYCGGFAEARNS